MHFGRPKAWVIVKGCRKLELDEAACGAISPKLPEVVKTLMYWEPCSPVPAAERKPEWVWRRLRNGQSAPLGHGLSSEMTFISQVAYPHLRNTTRCTATNPPALFN